MSPAPSSLPPDAPTISSGDLSAVFLPGRGMLGASLRHRGAEILRRVEDLEAAAVRGSTAGIPLLHPWANRLAGLRYRAAGKETTLDPASPLLHLDEHGLPMHGVPWSRLAWELTDATPESVSARLVLVAARSPRRLPVPARTEDDGDSGSRSVDGRDDPSRRPRSRPGQLRLSPLRRPAGRPARRVDASAPGHAAARSRRKRHPHRHGSSVPRRRRPARRPRSTTTASPSSRPPRRFPSTGAAAG